MFTVELKVNGALVSHVYGHNAEDLPDGRCLYDYEYYEVAKRKVKRGKVKHHRMDGLPCLVAAILEDQKTKK